MASNWNRRQFLTLLGGSLILPSACQEVESRSARSTQPAQRAASFTIFDALGYGKKPNVGLTRIWVNGGGFWKGRDRSKPDQETCQKTAREAISRNYSHFVINIEHWKYNGSESEIKPTIEKLVQVLDWMHEAAPSLKLSVYSIPPIRDYWTPVRHQPGALKGWRSANQKLKPIADASDFITPSLYTFYEDVPGWVTYASANIEEAQQFGKPVYPFLWCRYHNSNHLRSNQFIEGEYWRTQLETIRDRGANGVVLWDWAGHDRPVTNVLDTQQAWWQETVKFKQTL